MNGYRRLAVLAPLTVSSLVLGSLTFLAAPAHTAPAPSCGLSKSQTAGEATVNGKDFKPNKSVAFESAAGTEGTTKADASGKFTFTVKEAEGTVTAQQIGGPEVKCGTIAETEKKNAEEEFRRGFRDGLRETRETCKKEKPKTADALDPNYERGYDKGAARALERFC
ncbi:hypothetical protein AB0D57_19625 [Streptomyces sp. NPDC048275]|uniref:hypothetical protein n=1 Tax=Streptomyces sp. NPDC048275 TaxID=3155629 RepID=UPI0033D7B55E